MKEIVSAMAQAAREDLAKGRAEDRARPIGEKRIDIDFYDRALANRQRESYRADETKWSATLVKWNGAGWKRIRRLTGPLDFGDALSECSRLCRQRGLERV